MTAPKQPISEQPIIEQTIIDAFTRRYSPPADAKTETGGSLRLRSVSIFPGFDTAPPDEKESYLEAAEALERRGLLTLTWERRGRGERLKTLYCPDMARLFEAAGRSDPRTEAEAIRQMIRERLSVLQTIPGAAPIPGAAVFPFLHYLAEHYGPGEIARGMDRVAAEDLLRLMETLIRRREQDGLTTRALSVQLYRNSKRLEQLLELAGPLCARARKQGIPLPDLSPLERSFPETLIAGSLIFEYAAGTAALSNEAGHIIGLPAETVHALRRISAVRPGAAPAVLTIENKESFYALAGAGFLPYDCFLYSGGYPNEAAAALIRLLAASGFRFFHTGDLDPDGILILQNITEIAGTVVNPVQMNAAIFDRYFPWSRPLGAAIIRRLTKIRPHIRSIPDIAALIHRIAETGCGIEQEIVDFLPP